MLIQARTVRVKSRECDLSFTIAETKTRAFKHWLKGRLVANGYRDFTISIGATTTHFYMPEGGLWTRDSIETILQYKSEVKPENFVG